VLSSLVDVNSKIKITTTVIILGLTDPSISNFNFCFNFKLKSVYFLIFLMYFSFFFKQKYDNIYNVNNLFFIWVLLLFRPIAEAISFHPILSFHYRYYIKCMAFILLVTYLIFWLIIIFIQRRRFSAFI
jgi:hypothetical protein